MTSKAVDAARYVQLIRAGEYLRAREWLKENIEPYVQKGHSVWVTNLPNGFSESWNKESLDGRYKTIDVLEKV